MKTKAEGPTLRALIGCGLTEGNSTFSLFMDNKIRWWTLLSSRQPWWVTDHIKKVVSMCNSFIKGW